MKLLLLEIFDNILILVGILRCLSQLFKLVFLALLLSQLGLLSCSKSAFIFTLKLYDSFWIDVFLDF